MLRKTLLFGHKNVASRLVEVITTQYWEFVGIYFTGILAFIAWLVVYNLLKMFGLDKEIETFQKEFLEWFTDTDAVVGSAGDTDSEKIEKEDKGGSVEVDDDTGSSS